MSERREVRLIDKDWEMLLPSTPHTIGQTECSIYPLGLDEIAEVITKLQTLSVELEEAGITFENFDNPAKLVSLLKIVMTKAPGLLAKASGLHIDDLKKLPLDPAVALLSKVLDVNIGSQEGFVENLKALGEQVGSLTDGVSGTLPNSSSPKGTPGKKSKKHR